MNDNDRTTTNLQLEEMNEEQAGAAGQAAETETLQATGTLQQEPPDQNNSSAVSEKSLSPEPPPVPPAPPAPKADAAIGCILMILLLLGGGFLLHGCYAWVATPSAPAPLDADGAMVRCQQEVERQLKVPSSAEIDIRVAPPQQYGGGWTWKSTVEAQNSFGVKLLTPFVCTVTGSTMHDAVAEVQLLE